MCHIGQQGKGCLLYTSDARAAKDPFEGLVRIGIDEISYRRGHKYLTCLLYTSAMLAAPQDEKAPQPLTDTLMIDQTSSVSPAAEETAPSQSMGRRWGSLDSGTSQSLSLIHI